MVNMSLAPASPGVATEAPTNGNGHSGKTVIDCVFPRRVWSWVRGVRCIEVGGNVGNY